MLGLLFLKYIPDAFEEQHAKFEAEHKQGADPEDPDEYRAAGVFWVPPEARWPHLKAQARQATIGQLVDDTMAGVERDNPSITWRRPGSPVSFSPTARCLPINRAKARSGGTSSSATSWTAWWRCPASLFYSTQIPACLWFLARDETLRAIARELVATVRANVTIDWTVGENIRAHLRVLVKRILRKHGYPPDKQEKATQTVLEQAEVLSAEWTAA